MRNRAIAANIASLGLLGQAGGALVFGGIGLVVGDHTVLWTLVGLALGGAGGIGLGALASFANSGADVASDADRRNGRAWLSLAAGTVAGVAVTVASLALVFNREGPLESPPCPGAMSVVETYLPAQFTCVYFEGAVALVSPVALAVVSMVALVGSAALAYGAGRGSRLLDRPVLVVAVLLAGALGVDGVLGLVALV